MVAAAGHCQQGVKDGVLFGAVLSLPVPFPNWVKSAGDGEGGDSVLSDLR